MVKRATVFGVEMMLSFCEVCSEVSSCVEGKRGLFVAMRIIEKRVCKQFGSVSIKRVIGKVQLRVVISTA